MHTSAGIRLGTIVYSSDLRSVFYTAPLLLLSSLITKLTDTSEAGHGLEFVIVTVYKYLLYIYIYSCDIGPLSIVKKCVV